MKPVDASDSADRLESIRHVHRQEQPSRSDRMEDYLEVIYELIQRKGYATTVDISKYMSVSSPSVTKMVQRLDESGLVKYEKYRGIVLTNEGVSIAVGIRDRHNLLVEFLKTIGVDEAIANSDAEGIEHHLHVQTLKKLEAFLASLKKR